MVGGTAWSFVRSFSWFAAGSSQMYMVAGTLASLAAISAVNTTLFFMSMRWVHSVEVIRLSGRIHSIVGGLSGLPLVVLLASGVLVVPLQASLFGKMPYIIALSTMLVLVPMTGIVLSRSEQSNLLVLSNAVGLLGMFLGTMGFLLMWILALAGFAA